eukprot:jgi/Hompol1/4696/HPOL_000039-RA
MTYPELPPDAWLKMMRIDPVKAKFYHDEALKTIDINNNNKNFVSPSSLEYFYKHYPGQKPHTPSTKKPAHKKPAHKKPVHKKVPSHVTKH